MAKLKIGYVPEHFSTPIAFAQEYFDLNADLISVPTGTGTLAVQLKSDKAEESIDVAIGLTEGFVADLGKMKTAGQDATYGLAGTYVQSPLCWAISTGASRADLKSVEDLKGTRVGVSRIGSGSYVMSYVLADQHGWLDASGGKAPFEIAPIGDFAALRRSVNTEDKADFFMWEHFTTKHFWDNGELKRVGEIYTPWPSWMVAARRTAEPQLREMSEKLNKGIRYFLDHPDESVEYITSTMHYSKEDAREWLKTVSFAKDVTGVDTAVVESTVGTLKKAGVLDKSLDGTESMISVQRSQVASATV